MELETPVWPQMAVTILVAGAELGVPVARVLVQHRAVIGTAVLAALAQITTTQGAQFVTAEAEPVTALGTRPQRNPPAEAERRLAAADPLSAPITVALARPIAAEADRAGCEIILAVLEARELSLYGIFQTTHEAPVAQLQLPTGIKSIRLHLLELLPYPKKIKRIFKDESFRENRR
jgi:hypothetical protein